MVSMWLSNISSSLEFYCMFVTSELVILAISWSFLNKPNLYSFLGYSTLMTPMMLVMIKGMDTVLFTALESIPMTTNMWSQLFSNCIKSPVLAMVLGLSVLLMSVWSNAGSILWFGSPFSISSILGLMLSSLMKPGVGSNNSSWLELGSTLFFLDTSHVGLAMFMLLTNTTVSLNMILLIPMMATIFQYHELSTFNFNHSKYTSMLAWSYLISPVGIYAMLEHLVLGYVGGITSYGFNWSLASVTILLIGTMVWLKTQLSVKMMSVGLGFSSTSHWLKVLLYLVLVTTAGLWMLVMSL